MRACVWGGWIGNSMRQKAAVINAAIILSINRRAALCFPFYGSIFTAVITVNGLYLMAGVARPNISHITLSLSHSLTPLRPLHLSALAHSLSLSLSFPHLNVYVSHSLSIFPSLTFTLTLPSVILSLSLSLPLCLPLFLSVSLFLTVSIILSFCFSLSLSLSPPLYLYLCLPSAVKIDC